MKITKLIVIKTAYFLSQLSVRAKIFKDNKGFGTWLKEYQVMEKHNMFEPKSLRSMYISIIGDNFKHSFIIKQAVYCIAIYAYDNTLSYLQNSKFCIMQDGLVYMDEDGDELNDLDFCEALDICKAINEDKEDVYIGDNKTYEFIFKI